MYNDYKHRFSHLPVAICSTGKTKVHWQKSATLAALLDNIAGIFLEGHQIEESAPCLLFMPPQSVY